MSGEVKLSILMPVYNEARTVQAVVSGFSTWTSPARSKW